jgi:ABC-type multidrug transport system ATPase subunit
VVTQGQGWHVQGVCPQHDLLWDTLTAREHLNFYARLKRLSGAELVAAVDAALRSVNLFDVANKRAGQFSGGALMPASVHNCYC